MRKILFVVIIAVGIECTLPAHTTDVNQRLAALKVKLVQDIQHNQHGIVPIENDLDPLEEKAVRHGPITPISRQRKKKRTTRDTTRRTYPTDPDLNIERAVPENITTENFNIFHTVKPLRTKQMQSRAKKWAKHLKKYGSPKEIFYRRGSKSEKEEAELKRRHSLLCVDLLRPILSGMKKNATVTKIVGDQTANRLIQLLSHANMQAPEEIESILYQINNLHLRFFQWEVASIKKLFNFIMPGQKHSFKSMKHGLKKIFDYWHMDLSDTNLLIKESRMFRPPCVGTSEGSTRSSIGTRFTKPSTRKSTCAPKNKKCLVSAESSLE